MSVFRIAAFCSVLLAPAALAQAPAVDQFGDPLPKGAIARCGTATRLRQALVYSLAISPDGSRVVTRSGDGHVRIWDMNTGAIAVKLQSSERRFEAFDLAIAPDGKTLATSGATGVRLFDLSTGKEIAHLGERSPMQDRMVAQQQRIAFSKDGKALAAADLQLTIVWDLTTHRERARLIRCSGDAGVAFSSDGSQLIAAASINRGVTVWDIVAGKKLQTLGTFDQYRDAHGLALSPDGNVVAVAWARGVRRWDLATGKELPALLKGEEVAAIAFVSDGVLAAAGSLGWISLIDTKTQKLLDKFRSEPLLAVTPDGKYIACTGNAGDVIRLWDVKRGTDAKVFAGHQGPVHALAWSPDSKRLVSGGLDNAVRVWDPGMGKQVLELPQPWDSQRRYNRGVWSLALLRDGKTAAVIGDEGKVRLWNVASGRELRCLTEDKAWHWDVRASADGKYLAAQTGGTIRLWETATWKEMPALDATKAVAEADVRLGRFAFLPDGRTLAALSYPIRRKDQKESKSSSAVVVWDVPTGRLLTRVACPYPLTVLAVSPSPDGRTLALAGYEDTPPKFPSCVLLLETASGQERGRLPCSAPYDAAFAPDGWTLASRGGHPEDTAVMLWDLATLTKLDELEGPRLSADRLAFSPDGTRLASGGADTSILIWDVAKYSRSKRLPPLALTAKELERLWTALAGNAKDAYLAVKQLARGGQPAADFLAKRIEALKEKDDPPIAKLIAALDSAKFAEREQAMQRLEGLGQAAEGPLRKVLDGNPSLELRRRIEQLLKKLYDGPPPRELQPLRAIEALEDNGAPEARAVLEALAKGAADAPVNREAQKALKRLERK